MEVIKGFAVSALPWIGIGLFIAFSAVRQQAKKQGKTLSGLLNAGYLMPAVIFIAVAVLDWIDGNNSSAITWVVLAVLNLMLAFANGPVGEGNFFKDDNKTEMEKNKK